MSFNNCTALHYDVTLHLLAECDGQLDGTGRPHRVVVTVHYSAVHHFMVTLDYSHEHYKQ